MNKFDNFLKKALNKMFTCVGFEKFDEEFTKQEEWYLKKSWTQEQSEAFKKWFIQECVADLNCTKKMAEREFSWFDLKWGWKQN
jgi:hypothetical protein